MQGKKSKRRESTAAVAQQIATVHQPGRSFVSRFVFPRRLLVLRFLFFTRDIWPQYVSRPYFSLCLFFFLF